MADNYANTVYDQYYKRMTDCSGFLRFALVPDDSGESVHRLQAANFCRVRHCPICQWRRSLMWRLRTIRALTRVLADYPGKRFIYLTLTVKNCPLDQLSDTITHANQSWQRLLKRPQFKALGWLRNLEVTRQSNGDAHPHFHALLMVSPGYFAHDYLNQKDWIGLWRSCLHADYDPSVRVNVVKPRKPKFTDTSVTNLGIDEGLLKAIRYTLKYSTKPDDYISTDTSDMQVYKDWLIGLTDQMHNKRAIATGGIFRKYLSEDEVNMLIDLGKTDTSETENLDPRIDYAWRDEDLNYALIA